MDPEEAELQNDYRYRNYAAVIEKALRNFESSSEWADLISSLGKLNKALQSNLRYSLLPKRLLIGKRLAQCLHPALPSGVHLKALETYEVIFKIIGTKWLAKDLFIYSSGLFPLLGHAAMAVKPVLLTLYERYYLPLQRALLPSLQAFVTGLLPGLEEGLEINDRTDALVLKLSLLVGPRVFYGALWACILVGPAVRLPATVFVLARCDRALPPEQREHMLGYDRRVAIKSVCLSLQDSNVLVQRNMLEILLFFFPLATCAEPTKTDAVMSVDDTTAMVAAALLTLLRRDMSLNRRLYAWLLGTDIKGEMVAPHPTMSSSAEEHMLFYFNTYSKELIVKGLINILKQKDAAESKPENVIGYLRPFRILISLLDKPELGPAVLSHVLLEVVRAFYGYCRQTLGDDGGPSSGLSAHRLASMVKENKNGSEIIKTMNMLVSATNGEYLWEYMTRRFCACLSDEGGAPRPDDARPPPSLAEMSTLIIFLLDVLPLELHADIQSHLLPEMLGAMLRSLRAHLDSVAPEDVTRGLRACFKVLSKIQMPVAFADFKADDDDGGQTQTEEDAVAQEAEKENGERDDGQRADAIYPRLRSEDSGLGVSASPSAVNLGKNGHGVWRQGGSVHAATQCLQDIMAFITTRHLLVQVENVEGKEEKSPTRGTLLPSASDMKDKLTQLLAPNQTKHQPARQKKGQSDWEGGYRPRSRSEISEACRRTFVAACDLLLESTTFPVYLSEDEALALHAGMFGQTGGGKRERLPPWLRSLMTLSCASKDPQIQQVAAASLLELVNHSQSLALVIQDKRRRYEMSDCNPLSGQLQMVTVPPIFPALLAAMEDDTDFYQRLACVLWNQLDRERSEQHAASVELFYRLHRLAPSPDICEDVICRALTHHEKAVRLEALHRFSVLWHLTRETHSSRNYRSFDRSMCVVLESVPCADGAVSAAAQCWLLHAMSLEDVGRILEPVLLFLLHPSAQRCSVRVVQQNVAAGNLQILNNKSRRSARTTDPRDPEGGADRESLWLELERGPPPSPDASPASTSEGEDEQSERTESADSAGPPTSAETSEGGAAPNGLRRAESELTQASESLSSDDEEDLEAAAARLHKEERERKEAVASLFRHVLIYREAGGWSRPLRGLALLDGLLRSDAGRPLVEALSVARLDGTQLHLVSELWRRHRQAENGLSFYGPPPSPPAAVSPPSSLLELLVDLCLGFLRSHYSSYRSSGPAEPRGGLDVQLKSAETLTRLARHLAPLASGREDGAERTAKLLAACQVQRYALLALSASMYLSQRGADEGRSREPPDEDGAPSEENLIDLGQGEGREPLQVELLKLLCALIILEYHAGAGAGGSPPAIAANNANNANPLTRGWQTAVHFQQSIKAAQYVQGHPITAQGAFVAAAAAALLPRYSYAVHPHWVALLCSALPYLGRSLGIVVAPVVAQICANLDELVKMHEHDGGKVNRRRENIAPDYLVTLLEGLTTITHYCLLDAKRISATCDPVDIRNARSAVLEGLPQALGSMGSLWGALAREEPHKRTADSAKSAKRTSCVFFKGPKVLRQRILNFLVPLSAQYGIALMAALGAAWQSKKSKRRPGNNVLPEVGQSRLMLLDLVKSLNTLQTEAILQLVKEVVKKPHQLKGDQMSTLVDVPLLHFTYAYIKSLPATVLQENVSPLLSLLRESVQLNLAPPGHFLLLGILNEVVNRLPNLDNKKDTRELQEVTQRILEAVGGIAGSSLEQTSWLSRSLEVKVQSQLREEEGEPEDDEAEHCESMAQAGTMVSSAAPSVYSVQALVLLADVLAPLLDMVYRSDEKEKAVPLISRLMYYVFPYLKTHSAYNMPSFEAGSQLLSSLSGYAYTKRAWRKEVFELFVDPLFFTMDASCLPSWKAIIDHLLTHEKTMFKDLMSMQSGSLKLFASADQKPMLVKRQAFAVFSGELDQYHLYLPLIQERLTEALRTNPGPAVSGQIFLMFRVLLLRISAQHLTSLWPIMVTELIRVFARLEKALLLEKDVSKLAKAVRGAQEKPVHFSQAELDMYLSACKFLDTSLAFPPERMPLFQMYRWAFVPEVDATHYGGPENALMEGEQECKPHALRILEGIERRLGTHNGPDEESATEFPLLTRSSLSSIGDLLPFLRTLCSSYRGPPGNGHSRAADYPPADPELVLDRLELIVEDEFLDGADD
ncbi:protein DOP1B [Stigmatopora nigra]